MYLAYALFIGAIIGNFIDLATVLLLGYAFTVVIGVPYFLATISPFLSAAWLLGFAAVAINQRYS